MPTHSVRFYLIDPVNAGFPTKTGGSFVYSGPATAQGQAIITDNETGRDGLVLDDNVTGQRESALADVTDGSGTHLGVDVNADLGWTIRDTVTGQTFEVVGFAGRLGGYGFRYTLSEQPLVAGRSYQVIRYHNQPNAAVATDPVFTYSDYVCFAAESPILTSRGWRQIGTLRPGDMIETLDHGLRPLRWIGSTTVPGTGPAVPHRVRAGAFGDHGSFRVSANHCLMLGSPRAELYFGRSEVLVPAKYLDDGRRVLPEPCRSVTWCHLLFSRHEIVSCAGLWSESLFLGKATDAILAEARAELLSLFPRLARTGGHLSRPARPVLRRHEASLLLTDRGQPCLSPQTPLPMAA